MFAIGCVCEWLLGWIGLGISGLQDYVAVVKDISWYTWQIEKGKKVWLGRYKYEMYFNVNVWQDWE